MKPACHIHDRVNLVLLPIIGSLTVAGLLGYVDTAIVSAIFTIYVAVDLVWVAAIPEAVPSLPSVILLHHAVTLVLLFFPLRYPQFGRYTCWDGICEVNTFFLIARRQWRGLRTPFSVMYWATFFPMRILLYPYMLVLFYRELQAPQFAWWEVALCCGAQVILIAFNMILLWLSVASWRKPNHPRGAHPTTCIKPPREKITTNGDTSQMPRASTRRIAIAYGTASAAVRLRTSTKACLP